ncbi:MAG: hypothetical protein ACM30G_11600 [Micromonosporaceae bacterium]
MNPIPLVRRRWGALVALLAAAALLLALVIANRPAAAAGSAGSAAAGQHQHGQPPAPRTAQQVAFHDQMRKLWEDHVTWTRLAIVTFADGSAGFDATAARLLQNQTDIGDAVKPFYGDAAGTQLTALLHDHITIAVEVLQAAKAGDTDAFNAANARWYANANDIADFLAAANPRFWPQAQMRAAMQTHLDQTLTEASHELGGDYAAGVADYEEIHLHILAMADQLSAGIIGQFPSRFH